MKNTCSECNKPFVVAPEDLEFYKRVSPVYGNFRAFVPPPTKCPKCRLRTRLAFRNQAYVYLRKCSLTKEPLFSMYTDQAPFPVIDKSIWWRDSWDALDYGRNFDFSRTFFSQFEKLKNSVPHFPVSVLNVENSDYCTNVTGVKNCYLVFNTTIAEDSFYCENICGSRDCIDCTHTSESELCYDCVQCARCYAVQSSLFSNDCSDSCFLLHCASCSNCFACANLRQKSYCIFNEQKTRKEYEAFMQSIDLSRFSVRREYRDKAFEFFKNHPRPHVISRMAENSSGNLLFESRNVHQSFLIDKGENLKYCFNLVRNVRDCHDYTCFGNGGELMYQCASCGANCFNMRFCVVCFDACSDLDYCWTCVGCEKCFGCVGLRKKKYCILNKQYSKEEFNSLVPKMIEHMKNNKEWGEFFPISMSPVPYNQSYANRFFPLSKDSATEQGLSWYERADVSMDSALDASKLPDRLPETDAPLTLKSAFTNKPFKITSEEIRRYRNLCVPLPKLAYDERMEERAKHLGGIELFERACAKTQKTLLTTYPPDSPWIIWDREVFEAEFGA